MAALALSGDWVEEFLQGSDSASAPGLIALGDTADADWTKEFIAEAAGMFCFRCFSWPSSVHFLLNEQIIFLALSSVCLMSSYFFAQIRVNIFRTKSS